MSLDYSARVLADSMSPAGVRLTTIEATFPRIMLSEFNTHRVLSRNSASSRAIPPEKQCQRVLNSPFVPTFGSRVKGMGQGDDLTTREQLRMQHVWLEARDHALAAAERLITLNADKSHTNRLLEPFMWHTVIVSATEWDNFFALRTHEDAAPEIRKIVQMMQESMWLSEPRLLTNANEAHVPLVTEEEFLFLKDLDPEYWMTVSAGRCARVSFDTHDSEEDPEVSFERAERLRQSGHWSPFEHQAVPLDRPEEWSGNFRGWEQFRKGFAGESNFKTLLAIQGEG